MSLGTFILSPISVRPLVRARGDWMAAGCAGAGAVGGADAGAAGGAIGNTSGVLSVGVFAGAVAGGGGRIGMGS